MLKGRKWSIAILLIVAMLVLLSACGGRGGGSSSLTNQSAGSSGSTGKGNGGSADKQPEETITVFSMLANYAGEQPGWFAKMVKDKFNLKLNIVASNLAGGEQKIATMMASGNMGDLVVFGDNGKDYKNAIKAGLLLDWTKNGLLDKYGMDILKNAGQAIEANKQQYGGGTAVYGIGHDVGIGTGPSEGAAMTYGPDLRWDLYQKLGKPKIKTMDDYLPLLKKMQQIDPKSDSGRPTYAFSLWSDWDSDYMTLAKVLAQMQGYNGGDGFNPGDMILTAVDKPEYQGLLDPNSYYMKGLHFFYEANQMGLVDPDSLTQKFSDASNKYKDGQVLFSFFPWVDNVYNTPNHTSQGKGFELVPFQNEIMQSYGMNPYGGNRVWAIGSKAKDPARIMKFLDWLYTPEGMMEANWGPKGLAWNLDKKGKPYVTDYGWKALPANATPVPAQFGGGTFKDGKDQINNTTLVLTNTDPQTGEPYDYTIWPSTLKHQPNPVDASWRKAMGVLTPKDWFVKTKHIAVEQPFFNGKAPVSPPSDIQQKTSQIGNVIKMYSWKMIFAKNDAQFNSLKQQMIAKARGLGYDDVVKWELQQTKNTVWKAMKTNG